MTDLERALAAGGKLVAEPAPAPASAPAGQTDYQRALAAGGKPLAPELSASPELDPVLTFGQRASNVFGIGAALSGVLQSIYHGTSYEHERDLYRRALDVGSEQNPKAALAGSVASIVPETVIGGGVGRALGAGAKLAGLGTRLAEASPVVAGAARGALGGLGFGAAGGAGEALSEGKDVGEGALKGGAAGAALGGGIGAIGGKLGSLFRRAPEVFAEDAARSAAARALPKKQGAIAALLEEEAGASARTPITGKDVILEHRGALRKLRSDSAEKVAEGFDEVKAAVDALEVPKAAHYKVVDKALGGGIEAKWPIDLLENRAATETEAPWRRVLQNKADALKAQFSTVSTDVAKQALQRARVSGDQEAARNALEEFAARLPEGQVWTKAEFLDHLVGGNAAKNFERINPEVRRAVEQLPFAYDGSIKVPSRDIRRILTLSQDEAEQALGTLNQTKNAKLASLSQEVLTLALNEKLDTAALRTLGTPGVDKAVQAIRDTNKRQSVLLKINEAAARKLEKLTLAKPTLGGSLARHGTSLLSGYEALEAGKRLLHGDVGGAATSAAAAVAAKLAPKAATGARRGAVDLLTELNLAAKAGNPRALRLLRAAANARKVGTAGAGSVGSVSNGTLSQEEQTP